MMYLRTSILLLILVLALLFLHSDATRRGRRRRRLARRARHALACIKAQPGHIEKILATEELNIYSTDDVCHDNLKPHYPAMCDMIFISKTQPRFVDTFKRYYMEHIYTKENFPLTYRPDARIGNLNATTIVQYYNRRCYVHYVSHFLYVSFLLFLGTIVIIIITGICCAIPAKFKARQTKPTQAPVPVRPSPR